MKENTTNFLSPALLRYQSQSLYKKENYRTIPFVNLDVNPQTYISKSNLPIQK